MCREPAHTTIQDKETVHGVLFPSPLVRIGVLVPPLTMFQSIVWVQSGVVAVIKRCLSSTSRARHTRHSPIVALVGGDRGRAASSAVAC